MVSGNYLFWLDLEMTGLDSSRDTILEIASVITDNALEVVAQGPSLVIHQMEPVLEGMDDWNQRHHKESGLIDEVRQSTVSLVEAYEKTLAFAREYCKPQTAPLCGNTIYQDRAFLRVLMPELDQFLHYRVIDVSSIKEVVRRWYPKDPSNYFEKSGRHRALEDVYAAIHELHHYRVHFFKPTQPNL